MYYEAYEIQVQSLAFPSHETLPPTHFPPLFSLSSTSSGLEIIMESWSTTYF